MPITVQQVIRSINSRWGSLRTLSNVEFDRAADGSLLYWVGNSSVVFTALIDGERWRLKCYTSTNPRLKEIYGDRFLEGELFVILDDRHGEWIDLLKERWIEGEELSVALARFAVAGDSASLKTLSERFDSLALSLLTEESAHGDITADNIIVDSELNLHLIDFDGAFIPQTEGLESLEVGTEAYQHPSRTRCDFDRDIDDYSLALISTALALIAMDPSLYIKYRDVEGLLFDPSKVVAGKSEFYDWALDTLSRVGDAPSFRVAQMLSSLTLRLPELKRVLEYKVHRSERLPESIFRDGALWGYSDEKGEVATPPLFDEAFDFSEEAGAVKIGGYWHYVDARGFVVMDCSEYVAIKPRLGGKFRVLSEEGWLFL